MAFESVGNQDHVYLKYNECVAGQVIAEGVFIKEGIDRFSKPSWHVECEDGIHVLNSCGHLDHNMKDNVSVGDFIRVTYLGTVKLTRGPNAGKNCHQFKIERDPSRSTTEKKNTNAFDSIPHPADTASDFSYLDAL